MPLSRYIGAWTFPPSGGQYHGVQPDFVDLVVNEQDGKVTGALFGRFRLAAGSSDEPILRFNFSGDLQATRNQLFALQTSDGARGSLDLIPGPAFNLLEVNFQTEPMPGKIRNGNFILMKK